MGSQIINNLVQATWHGEVGSEQEIWTTVLPPFIHVTMCQLFCLVPILEIVADFIFTIVLHSWRDHLSSSTFTNRTTEAQRISKQAIVGVRRDPRRCAGISLLVFPSLLP